MRLTLKLSLAALAACLPFASPAPAAAAEDTYKVRLVAGAPGYDHIQPFMAEYLGFWKKYGVEVEFIGGNYIRGNQMMSTGDFDAGYNQLASAMRYTAAGVSNIIVGASSANCALIVADPKVKSWADFKGKRFGIVTKFDVQYMTLIHHILPRFGLSEKDVNLALVPVPETAAALMTGDVPGAFPFEPYGAFAVEKGAKLMLAADEMIDKKQIDSDMLRNGLIMNKKFMTAHPDLARKIMWAHMDAVEKMRTDPEVGIDTIAHYNPNLDVGLIRASYKNCGWNYQKPPKVWIDTLIKWMKEDKLLSGDMTYEQATDFSLQEGYPGFPGWEKK
jgi:ABC-type nitrate/sulfonate/bicarbonate transport system substrate-binding protein